jgi:hypothetical protein
LETQRVLSVLDGASRAPATRSLTSPASPLGWRSPTLSRAGEPLTLRVLLDGSALEVFTSTGETLTSRMYRGHPPACPCPGCGHGRGTDPTINCDGVAPAAPPAGQGQEEDRTGVALFASGAAVEVESLDVWEMGSCRAAAPALPAAAHAEAALAAVVARAADAEAAAAEVEGALPPGAKPIEAGGDCVGATAPHAAPEEATDEAQVAGSFLEVLHINSA